VELEFTSDQDALRDAIRAVLTNESPVTLARAVVGGGTGARDLWATEVGLGWPALTVPEVHGGIGLGMLEAAILAEELGRVIAPGPLLATVTQFVPVLAECGTDEQQARFLGAVAAGEIAGTLAIGAYDPSEAPASFTGGVLAGEVRGVIEGDTVDEIAIVVRTGSDVGVVVVPAADVAATPVRTIDGSRRLVHLHLDGVRVADDRVLGRASADGVRRALEHATVGLALEMVGTAQTIFDVTLDYAKHREQFGVPIGSFQAIKHKFADMLIALERARATGYFAALTIAEDDPRRASATSVAKAAAGDCQRLLGKEGIQILGGIGYTWEHDMHLYVKRMKSGETMFGSTGWHRARIADALGV